MQWCVLCHGYLSRELHTIILFFWAVAETIQDYMWQNKESIEMLEFYDYADLFRVSIISSTPLNQVRASHQLRAIFRLLQVTHTSCTK